MFILQFVMYVKECIPPALIGLAREKARTLEGSAQREEYDRTAKFYVAPSVHRQWREHTILFRRQAYRSPRPTFRDGGFHPQLFPGVRLRPCNLRMLGDEIETLVVHKGDGFAVEDSAVDPELAIRIRDRCENTVSQFEIAVIRRKRVRVRLRMLANREAFQRNLDVEGKIPPANRELRIVGRDSHPHARTRCPVI